MSEELKNQVCEIIDERMGDSLTLILDRELGKYVRRFGIGAALFIFGLAGTWYNMTNRVSQLQLDIAKEVIERKEADTNMQKTLDDRLTRIEDGIEKITDWFIVKK